MKDAIKAARDGVSLDIEVVPGASRSEFPAGYNKWRNRIETRVAAPAEKGEANAELCRLVAAFFEVPNAAVTVTSGHTSRRKTLMVGGVSVTEAVRRLSR